MSRFRKLTETLLKEYDPFGAAYDQWRTTDPRDDEPDYSDKIEQRWAIRSLNDWVDIHDAPDVKYTLYVIKNADGTFSTDEDCTNDSTYKTQALWDNESDVLRTINEIKSLNHAAKLQPVKVYGYYEDGIWYEDFEEANSKLHQVMADAEEYF